jgi:cupin 2 domain-containing protein
MPDAPFARGRLLAPSAAPSAGERTEILAAGDTWRVEQILSGALPQPVDDLLDHVEWVMVVSGGAELDVAGRTERLDAGDWVRLGPGLPHRVLSTEPGTSWLAVHVELDGRAQ